MPRIAFGARSSLVWSGLCLGACLGLGACTTANVVEPSDDPGSQQLDVVDDASASSTAVVAGPGPTAGAASTGKPTQPYNCQAPLGVIEEVSRMLTIAGTHATRSAACVDGPGQRVTLDEILVCPMAPDGTRRSFGVTYRVTTWEEGGRQVCPGGKCPPVEAEHTFHRIDVAFRPEGSKYVIDVPSTVPGLPLDATPIASAHDGDCYGSSPAFVPQPLPLR